MRQPSRLPLLFAGTLAVAGVVLLWLRVPPREGTARAHPGTPTATAPLSATGAEGSVPVAPPPMPEPRDGTEVPLRAAPGTVGAGFREDSGQVSIAWLAPEGPAARAGAKVGHQLVAVDGRVVHSLREAESRTRGTPGTPVRLQVREDGGAEHEVLVTRAD